MELIYSKVIYVGIAVLIVLLLWSFRKKHKYEQGKKVANASVISDTRLYKTLLRRYKFLRFLVVCVVLSLIGVAFLMLARPAKLETITYTNSNRDIMLCLDVSDSMDQLNLKLCDKLIDIVNELHGDRFGITVFCGKSVELVPLTDDYEYVTDTLEKLKESFEASTSSSIYYNQDVYNTYYFKYAGTMSDYGTSLIGDGLAGALFNFDDLYDDPDRVRIIVFCTDNELYGPPLISVDDAAQLCADHDVKVLALIPPYTMHESDFASSIRKTGGDIYRGTQRRDFKKVIDEIKGMDTSDIIEIRTIEKDMPQLLFIVLISIFGCYCLICKWLKI